jgi:diphthamide biosynthesis methyltransferase
LTRLSQPIYEVTVHSMLYLVGLGLADETDITVKGLEAVKKADRVYLEAYTSILLVDKEKLVRLPGQSNQYQARA